MLAAQFVSPARIAQVLARSLGTRTLRMVTMPLMLFAWSQDTYSNDLITVKCIRARTVIWSRIYKDGVIATYQIDASMFPDRKMPRRLRIIAVVDSTMAQSWAIHDASAFFQAKGSLLETISEGPSSLGCRSLDSATEYSWLMKQLSRDHYELELHIYRVGGDSPTEAARKAIIEQYGIRFCVKALDD